MTNAEIKHLHSLHQKKYREKNNTFFVEGATNVLECLKTSYKIKVIYGSKQFFDSNKKELEPFMSIFNATSPNELQRAGTLETNNSSIALLEIPATHKTLLPDPTSKLVLVFAHISDPGNFGALIRVADWYGFTDILCSKNTVDFFNPKVLHATMGSWSRVNAFYIHLEDYFEKYKNKTEIYGAVLNGKNLHTTKLNKNGILLIGNEAHGISDTLLKYITVPLTIPRFGKAESLNVATATAVFCDYFRRTLPKQIKF
ncbi:MAG: hypothetical protein A3H98_09775 [Bacteroidetes bacterium RIFCSPLOWO2_02_FULL_36_8]|nr:MAG: hypothetical protein A3H98_09775 [Bacteroidetes bacterium RIFCSPLOWO2_02_FULL_36_8]OFY68776.1 MAG: hypothetical protein A3G23_03000 [Bacteroidetes bacterium RIFCSPLOWO2_12_FULL_37_12]